MRLEKGYRDFGVDIDNIDTALEAGLGFVVDLNKPDFTGRDALVAQKAAGPLKRRLVQFLPHHPSRLCFPTSQSCVTGAYVGYIRAGVYGPTLGASVGLKMFELAGRVTPDILRSHRFKVEVNDRRITATPSLAPMYDAKSDRVRA